MFSTILVAAFMLTMFANGFTTSIGAALHDEAGYPPPPPLGVVRIEAKITDNVQFVAQHLSSVPSATDSASGVNSVGIELTASIPGLLTPK